MELHRVRQQILQPYKGQQFDVVEVRLVVVQPFSVLEEDVRLLSAHLNAVPLLGVCQQRTEESEELLFGGL